MNAIALAVLAGVLVSAPAARAAETDANKPQTTRMSQCSSQAKEQALKGDARKEFMSQCLRNPGARTATKECNSAAAGKGLKGEQRKAFVDECIRNKDSAGTMG